MRQPRELSILWVAIWAYIMYLHQEPEHFLTPPGWQQTPQK